MSDYLPKLDTIRFDIIVSRDFTILTIPGPESAFHKMVNIVLCRLCSRSSGFSSCDIRQPFKPGRTCRISMGVVHRIPDGIMHIGIR
jgi:hypothetical protein